VWVDLEVTPIMNRTLASTVTAVVLAATAGCANDDQASRVAVSTDNPSTAYQLAVVDGNTPQDEASPVVTRYQQALDDAAGRCTQGAEASGTEPGVGDLAVRLHQLQPGGWTALSALQSIVAAVPPSAGKLDCVDVVAALTRLVRK